MIWSLATSPIANPAIAVTKTETLTSGQMDELAGTVAEVFQIRSDEQDRVIFTGVGDETYRSAWTSKLIQVINKYALSAGGSDAGRLRELEKLLDTELATVKAALENELDAQSISEHLTERQADRMREVFTKASERYRNRYAKGCASTLIATWARSRTSQRRSTTPKKRALPTSSGMRRTSSRCGPAKMRPASGRELSTAGATAPTLCNPRWNPITWPSRTCPRKSSAFKKSNLRSSLRSSTRA